MSNQKVKKVRFYPTDPSSIPGRVKFFFFLSFLFVFLASRLANAGAFNLRQIILGTFDHKIHTTGQADTMDIFNKTYKEILGIETVPGTNMPANFGHMVGYDAQYYGYLVSFSTV